MENENLSPPQNTTNNNPSKLQSLSSQILPKKSLLLSSLLWFPSYVLALFFILLLGYSSFTILYFDPLFSIHKNTTQTHKKQLQPTSHSPSSTPIFELGLAHFQNASISTPSKPKWVPAIPPLEAPSTRSFKRVEQFFLENFCKVRLFVTWISPLDSFGERERFTIESLFKFNPNCCLVIVSKSMDTDEGARILSPFFMLGFRVMAVSPDYGFIFKDTMGASWYDKLERGEVDPGVVPLGQSLSNLVRLCLLYKYGGIYMDTDFIVLKRLDKLKNSIGAQNVDPKTKNWRRLNNAFMAFDKKHPLLSKFIEEFALNYNGNKWGHNGPYLVSRVIKKLKGTNHNGGNFTILPPSAFYPVSWDKIGSLFRRPIDEAHLKWVRSQFRHIQRISYALHLWNRKSRGVAAENGSVISHLMKDSCIFCNTATPKLLK